MVQINDWKWNNFKLKRRKIIEDVWETLVFHCVSEKGNKCGDELLSVFCYDVGILI